MTTSATLASMAVAQAASIRWNSEDVVEFISLCVGYFHVEQCDDAARFAHKTYRSRFYAQLHDQEAPQGFLEMLEFAVRGGEALNASEIASAHPPQQ
jgi:hypothetical protein